MKSALSLRKTQKRFSEADEMVAKRAQNWRGSVGMVITAGLGVNERYGLHVADGCMKFVKRSEEISVVFELAGIIVQVPTAERHGVHRGSSVNLDCESETIEHCKVCHDLIFEPLSNSYYTVVALMNGLPGTLRQRIECEPGIEPVDDAITDGGMCVSRTPCAAHFILQTVRTYSILCPCQGQSLPKQGVVGAGERHTETQVLHLLKNLLTHMTVKPRIVCLDVTGEVTKPVIDHVGLGVGVQPFDEPRRASAPRLPSAVFHAL